MTCPRLIGSNKPCGRPLEVIIFSGDAYESDFEIVYRCRYRHTLASWEAPTLPHTFYELENFLQNAIVTL